MHNLFGLGTFLLLIVISAFGGWVAIEGIIKLLGLIFG
jgi:hypothetical protein